MPTTYVILGSGGHTAEMCKINQALLDTDNEENASLYQPIRYIVANSDETSQHHLLTKMPQTRTDDFITVPRSRSVGQSWMSTIFTTIWALIWSCWLIWRDQPQLVICNGPGTCVPYCYAAYLWRLLGRLPRHTRIVFIESFCRVESISLSGRLLMPVADMFVVHWPTLAKQYEHKQNVRYFGRIF